MWSRMRDANWGGKWWLMAAVLFFTAKAGAANDWNPHDVVSTNTCAECHEEAVDVWKQTKHFATYRNFHKTKEAKEIAIDLGMDPKKIKRADSMCADCHYTKGVKNNRVKPVAGISCQSCHGAANNWVEIHNDYGGPSVTQASESAAHKKQRYTEMHAAGMVYPANLLGLAENCFQCHLIANPDLINKTNHPTSSDFDLVERSQGNILHSPAADESKRGKLAIAGMSAQLIQSLNALAAAKRGNRFGDQMTVTAQHAANNIKSLSQQLNDPDLAAITKELAGLDISAGNPELAKVSQSVSAKAIKLVGVEGSISQRKKLAPVKIAKPEKPKKLKKPKLAVQAENPANTAATVQTHQTAKTVRVAPKAKAAEPKYVRRDAQKENLIRRFEAFQPLSPVMCRSRAPWMRGRYPLQLSQFKADQSCLGFQVDKVSDSSLALFAQTSQALVRLYPNRCGFLGNNADLSSTDSVTLPVNANQQASAVKLSMQPSVLFAVVADSHSASAFEKLVEQTDDVCQLGNDKTPNITQLLTELNRSTNNGIQWLEYR